MKKVLLIYGGVKTPIDQIRSISNSSSGATGAYLANALADCAEVSVISAVDAINSKHIPLATFSTFSELQSAMQGVLDSRVFDLVIMLAAVSDYRVEQVLLDGKELRSKKIPSGHQVTLQLVPNDKLISQIKYFSKNPQVKIVGFKLTAQATTREVENSVSRVFAGQVDWVVHNDISMITNDRHPFTVYYQSVQNIVEQGESKVDMAQAIIKECLQ